MLSTAAPQLHTLLIALVLAMCARAVQTEVKARNRKGLQREEWEFPCYLTYTASLSVVKLLSFHLLSKKSPKQLMFIKAPCVLYQLIKIFCCSKLMNVHSYLGTKLQQTKLL